MKKRMYEKKCRASFAKWICVLTLIALAYLTYQTAWADDDFELDPLVQVSGSSSFPSTGCIFEATGFKDTDFFQPGFTFTPNGEVEPSMAINPNDPNNIVVAYQQDRWNGAGGGARGHVVSVSTDGGETWQQVVPTGFSVCPGPDEQGNQGIFIRLSDPWLFFAPNGVLYQAMWAANDVLIELFPIPPFSGPPPPTVFATTVAILVAQSNDGGFTWGDPSVIDSTWGSENHRLTANEHEAGKVVPHAVVDKPTITADPFDEGLVYTVWDSKYGPVSPNRVPPEWAGNPSDPIDKPDLPFPTEAMFSRTTDGGNTWNHPSTIYHQLCNSADGNQILVLPDGTLVDIFRELVRISLGEPPCVQDESLEFTIYLSLMRSTNKGLNWNGISPSQPIRIDQMLTVPTNVVDPDDPLRIRGIRGSVPAVAVDSNNGALYVVWRDSRFSEGKSNALAFSMSIDGGFTWTPPIKVNQTPANPDLPLNQNAFLPSVAVAADGTVAVTYYDFRNNNRGISGVPTDYWMVHCHSNCANPQSWNEIRLTETSFNILRVPLGGGLMLGDYVALTADGNDFLAAFPMPHGTDPASVFFRRVSKKEQ